MFILLLMCWSFNVDRVYSLFAVYFIFILWFRCCLFRVYISFLDLFADGLFTVYISSAIYAYHVFMVCGISCGISMRYLLYVEDAVPYVPSAPPLRRPLHRQPGPGKLTGCPIMSLF